MIELNGKYNTAKVFTDNIDTTTISQVIELLNQEFIKDNQIRIMPDCHSGTGCVIGTTMTIKDKIVPNLVGVDIGCSVLTVKLGNKKVNLKDLDEVINNFIPSGYDKHEKPVVYFPQLKNIIAPINIDNANKSLGSLGGGNHYCELNEDKNGDLWLTVHTGSRHLGIEICKYYQELAFKKLRKTHIQTKIQETISKLKAEGKEKDIENTIKILKMQYLTIPKDLCYVEGNDFYDYLHDMKIAQEYAKLNRQTIINIICKHMNFKIIDYIDTMHNYIDLDNMILRKGAVSAQKGEKLIIPMNMRDGSLICVGKGNPDWNYSAPHGAGRIFSRQQARDILDMNDFVESMKDIYSTSVVESTIDEAPMVYKPMQEIIDNIQDSVDIIDIIKPIYNYKAH